MQRTWLTLALFLFLASPTVASEPLQPCPPRPRNQTDAHIDRGIASVPRTAKAVMEAGGFRAAIPVPFLGFYPQPWQIGCVRQIETLSFAFWQASRSPLKRPDLPLEEHSDTEGENFVVQVILMAPALRDTLAETYESVHEASELRTSPVKGPDGLAIYPGSHPRMPVATLLYEDKDFIVHGECTDTYCSADTYYDGFGFQMLFSKDALPHWKDSARAAVELLKGWRAPAN
jgi:hypothetical protein